MQTSLDYQKHLVLVGDCHGGVYLLETILLREEKRNVFLTGEAGVGKTVLSLLSDFFKQEFLNRIDEIIIFNNLSEKNIKHHRFQK